MSLFKEFLTFSKRDRMGIIALLILFGLSLLIYLLIDFIPVKQTATDFTSFEKQINEFESQRNQKKVDGAEPSFSNSNYSKPSKNLFQFDPNTITKDSLILLGIYENVADLLIKYRSSGAKFKSPEDLKKVYGFTDKLFNRLEEYIVIKNLGINELAQIDTNEPSNNSPKLININTADTTELKSLKGIGSKLASRIVKFRNNAGGFYSTDQLLDVYGIKTELLNSLESKIQVDQSFQKININTVSAEELKNHPYIYKWNIANAIVNYRTKHGNYKQATDLMKTDLVSDDLCRKIAPYLIFE